jgi:hypothetical protein
VSVDGPLYDVAISVSKPAVQRAAMAMVAAALAFITVFAVPAA